MMKTLSVRQPWATLLVSGLKDIENRTWAPHYSGRILIHASLAKVPKSFSNNIIFEQSTLIANEQLFGNIPNYEDMEYGAIIGYVTVDGDGDDSLSVWADPVEHQWHISKAFIFDEPIRGVKGKLLLFDTPDIDEWHLPAAHKLHRRAPQRKKESLVLPLTDAALEDVLNTGEIVLNASEEICNLVEKPVEELKEDEDCFYPMSTLRVVTPTRKMTFAIKDIDYQRFWLDDGTTRKAVDWDMDEIEYFNLSIRLKDVANDK